MSTKHSYISNAHPAFLDALYQDYQQNATAVDLSWRKFFEGFDFAMQNSNGHTVVATNGVAKSAEPKVALDQNTLLKELKVYHLIIAYRERGHLLSDTNPIKTRKNRFPYLDLKDFGLVEADLTQSFVAGHELQLGTVTLTQIIARLNEIYAAKLGIEYQYITDAKAKKWIQDKFEQRNLAYGFNPGQKKRILNKLNETVVFEQFLHKKYIGQKRFSLEGGESAIPALDAMINLAGKYGVEEVLIGMAHRGRLNVLANIMGKTYEQIFTEFEGDYSPKDHSMGDGDVKYHLGYSSQVETTANGKVYLKLVPNPSHLESVDPVVHGLARAKADVIYNSDYDKILPILIHGDAAIAGQGIVYEVAQMSKLEGYHVGGTIHFVINNQIGFTTDFDDARSSNYCTSVASIVKAPVIHVNGDDVESVVFAAEFAAEYRQEFNADIYIDMVCYRRHGHNEGDDPRYTQARMYKKISNHPNPRELYVKKLIADDYLENTELANKMDKAFWDLLQERFDMVKEKPLPYIYQEPELAWKLLRRPNRADFEESPETGIDREKVAEIVKALISLPNGFSPISKVNRLLKQRRKTMQENKSLDWAAAELMAYGSILLDGEDIRMSGQDVKRGTFSHRHAVVYDDKTFESYNRLNHIAEGQGRFLIYNSLLSEYAVLGFEFGYSFASPDSLTIWEAQFGDFANGAQIMIDQYVTSSQSKWDRMSGLIMLLPHGYAGQGPEHSSARLERFLQSCAEKNITVANITTPANFFHAIRRQQNRPFRTPLVVMSPKSLLRHPKCTSNIEEVIGEGKRFQEFIDDPILTTTEKAEVRKVLLCSGKIYYDLEAKRAEDNIKDVAIIRIEQLYPLVYNQLNAILQQYGDAKLVWVQEEPANMGALWHLQFRLNYFNFDYVARKTSASPATGYKKRHDREQADIIKRAFE